MDDRKRIALIAHDNRKLDLLDWARFNRGTLEEHELYATWDPLQPQPHDVDVKALRRIAVVHDCPIACNRATADFLLSSPLLRTPYQRMVGPLQPAAA